MSDSEQGTSAGSHLGARDIRTKLLFARAVAAPLALDRRSIARYWSLYLAYGLLAVTILLLGIREIYLGYDSIGNYAHVWYISKQIFMFNQFPLRIDVLDGGNGLALPYAVLPWSLGAALFHFLGNRAVTLLMVAGVAGVIWTANLARLRFNPWLTAVLVTSPVFLHEGILSFQLPFFWAVSFFFLYVYFFEKRRYLLATLAIGAAMYTHPFLAPPAFFVYNAVSYFSRPGQRRAAVIVSLAGFVILLPMLAYVHSAPLITTGRFWYLFGKLAERMGRGEPLILIPFLLARYRRFLSRYAPTLIVVSVAGNLVLLIATQNAFGLLHDSDPRFREYLQSPSFVPAATYRILAPGQREDAMYYFVQGGAVLPNDFFTESQFRQSWQPGQYRQFLTDRAIDFVVLEDDYPSRERTNEDLLLSQLVEDSSASIVYRDAGNGFTVFDVRPLRVRGL